MLKEVLFKATHAAGNILKESFHSHYKIHLKEEGINNVVTEIDLKIENLIRKIIWENFPNHHILGEENGLENKENSSYRWIIDPIDGTSNFVHKIPLCCISIGLEYKGEIILGAVYNPLMNEFFWAEKGKGAFLNEEKIAVSNNQNLKKAMLVTGFPYIIDQPKFILNVFEKIVTNGIPIRRLGSAAIDICWVACGRFDAFYETHLKPWDLAGGLIILQEAGGKATDFQNNNYTFSCTTIVASNTYIHNNLLNLINE